MKKISFLAFFISLFYFAPAQIVLTGVYDAQAGGFSSAKGYEIYVVNDIPDLSIYGLGLASNGNGSNGQDFTFSNVAASAGTFIYVAADSTNFHNFFGFAADYINSVSNINGDDAIELYGNGNVIDVFGEVDTDGTGEAWEYLDGWAYRIMATGPDATFMPDNWTYSGTNTLESDTNNEQATTPFPIGTYSLSDNLIVTADDNATTSANTGISIFFATNDFIPPSLPDLSIEWTMPTNGTVEFNGQTYSFTYIPIMDFCGEDSFMYTICDDNDLSNCSTSSVNITVECPLDYPSYSVAMVTTNNTSGLPDSLGLSCELTGVVHGINFQGADALSFVLIDENGDGIVAFNDDTNLDYTVTEGDLVSVQGVIGQFAGLAEIIADNVSLISAGNALQTPLSVTTLDESTESQLVQLDAVSFVDSDQWTAGGSGFNVQVSNGVDTFTIRIDNEVDLFNMPAPDPSVQYTIRGLGGQFDLNTPYDEGYQLLPRYSADIFPVTSTRTPAWATTIELFPNPTSNNLTIYNPTTIDQVRISNALGQVLVSENQVSETHTIDVSTLASGYYFVSFVKNKTTWTQSFVKE